MKKCPFCKANVEDNARFCLYCMKPLNEKEVVLPPQEKKQWWPLVVTGVLLIALLTLILLIPREDNASQGETSGEESSSSIENTDESTQDSQGEDDTPSGNTDTKDTQQSSGATNTNQAPGQKPNNITTEQEIDKITPVVTPSVQPERPTDGDTEETTEETTQETTKETTEETTEETAKQDPPAVAAVYSYRAARAGDDFNANYANSGNDIVITGIAQPSANGIYDIPSYIDGKKVIAITANAFSGSNAKVVYAPATMKTIWNYAFAGCSLTDIYFRGSAIYVESKAFSGALTIHCSASCSDRDFNYYKNCATSYGATWKEWNG